MIHLSRKEELNARFCIGTVTYFYLSHFLFSFSLVVLLHWDLGTCLFSYSCQQLLLFTYRHNMYMRGKTG